MIDFILELAKVEEKTVTLEELAQEPPAAAAAQGAQAAQGSGAGITEQPLPRGRKGCSLPISRSARHLAGWTPDRFRLSMGLPPT